MSETRQKFLCEAVATTNDGGKLFITVYQVGSGIEFSSGTGSMKYGTPRKSWTDNHIKQELAFVYDAKTVEIMHPEPASRKLSDAH